MTEAPAVRMPPLDPAHYSEAQKKAEADFRATRNVGFSGPWHVLIRSPELLTRAQHMGSYLRYRCSLSGRLSETAILLVAREWTQDFEFGEHRKYALQAGVAEATIEAIRHGRRPQLEGDDLLVYDFVTELLKTRRVSDATYAAALARFGDEGVVDLAGITGYYSLLAMAMNVARVGPPAGEPRLPRFPE